MTRPRSARSALIAGCIFLAGWLGGAAIERSSLPSPLGRALAQPDRTPLDTNFLALMLGIASVAVDTESAAARINELTDRLAALERRVQQIEKPASK